MPWTGRTSGLRPDDIPRFTEENWRTTDPLESTTAGSLFAGRGGPSLASRSCPTLHALDLPRPFPYPRLRPASAGPILLRDVTRETGITFKHTDGAGGRHYVIEPMTSGLATFDYDGDGLIDVYFLNGRPLRGTKADATARNALYRNLGGFRFVDVTDKAGVGNAGYGLGVCIGDYDGDGWPDIYVNNYGPNVLYHNNGDGTFSDVTAKAGVARGDTVGAGANFLDIDGDGELDLFVANYIRFTYENNVTIFVRAASGMPGRATFPSSPTVFTTTAATARSPTSRPSRASAPMPDRGWARFASTATTTATPTSSFATT